MKIILTGHHACFHRNLDLKGHIIRFDAAQPLLRPVNENQFHIKKKYVHKHIYSILNVFYRDNQVSHLSQIPHRGQIAWLNKNGHFNCVESGLCLCRCYRALV